MTSFRHLFVRVTLIAGFALTAPAEEVVLRAGNPPGDSFLLSLESHTRTESKARGREDRRFAEDLRVSYEATVTVLETDADGRPVHELHRDVTLTVTGPEGSASLFGERRALEVRREPTGIEVRSFGRRVSPAAERLLDRLLGRPLEHTRAAQVFAPGRPVEVGERWELDPVRTEALLADHGLNVVRFAEPPSATLERDGEVRVVRYRIPVSWLAVEELPANTRTARSRAMLEGRIELPSDAFAPLTHASRLAMDANGAIVHAGVARPVPWSFSSTHTVRERKQRLQSLASHTPR
jgi:hypothetical protein